MILANTIEFPLVMKMGFLALVPMTLLVAGIECGVFWGLLRVPTDRSYKPLLLANFLSALAGTVFYGFQNDLLREFGIRSIHDYRDYYPRAALLLIVLYFAGSLLVEGLWLTRRKITQRFGTGRGKIWRTVFLANVASYLVLGPAFYFGTGLTFHGASLVGDPAEVTDCTDRIYFISSETGHLQRICANGTGLTTVVPHVMEDYLVSEDEQAFLYRDPDRVLWFCRSGEPPVRICQNEWRLLMTEVDLAADKARVVYPDGPKRVVRNVLTGEILGEGDIGYFYGARTPLAWDAKDPTLLRRRFRGQECECWRIYGDSLVEVKEPYEPAVGNFRRWGGQPVGWGDHDFAPSWYQKQGGYILEFEPVRGCSVKIYREGFQVLHFQIGHGMFASRDVGPREAFLLDEPGLFVCQAPGTLCIVNAQNKLGAFLAKGKKPLAPIARFRADFEQMRR
jgi:hypothetical protein